MSISMREAWNVIHGMLFGAAFLLAFAGGLAGLYSLRPAWVTVAGTQERVRRLQIGLWGMAAIAWATVISGTYIVYPWYRATPPAGTSDFSAYPRSLLLSSKSTAHWHTFGMEWKEHVSWLAPIAATVVAFAVTYYGQTLAQKANERRVLLLFYMVAFLTAGIAGVFGAFINKVAPFR